MDKKIIQSKNFSIKISRPVFLLFLTLLVINLGLFLFYVQLKQNPSAIAQKSYAITDVVKDMTSDRCNRGDANYNDCLASDATNLIKKYQFKDILLAYEKVQSTNQQSSCHDSMHHIARNEYKKDKDLPRLFNDCSSVCFNACYHGAVLGYITEENLAGSTEKALEKTIVQACDSIKNSSKEIQHGNCIHGVGHSLMLITNNDLPKALKLCDSYPDTLNQETCYGGVFMENFPASQTTDHPSKYVKANDPLYPCNNLQEKYQKTCYTYLTDYFGFLTNFNPEKKAKMCELVPSEYRHTCYTTFGSSALGNTSDLQKVGDICEFIATDEGKQYCIQGVVMSFADRFGGDDKKLLQMFDFCNFTKDQYKQSCFAQAGNNLNEWIKDESRQEQICQKFSSLDEREWCLQGGTSVSVAATNK